MEIPLLASTVWLWRHILDRTQPGLSLGVTAGTVLQMAVPGAFVTFAPRPLFEAHFLTTEAFGLTALEDQQYAGLLMWVPGIHPLCRRLPIPDGDPAAAVLGKDDLGEP